MLWVIGISETGYREHLGVWMGPSESPESRVRVFRDLTQRGLEGVEYVVRDEHAGLVQALGLYPRRHTSAARCTTSGTRSRTSARTRCAPNWSRGCAMLGRRPRARRREPDRHIHPQGWQRQEAFYPPA
jgi:putative transposase